MGLIEFKRSLEEIEAHTIDHGVYYGTKLDCRTMRSAKAVEREVRIKLLRSSNLQTDHVHNIVNSISSMKLSKCFHCEIVAHFLRLS